MNLREYQLRAIDALRRSLSRGIKRVMLYSPTGSGKTEIGIEMIRLARGKGKRIAFVCNRVELVRQASARFWDSGIDHGVIQGNNTLGTWKEILICSIQTLAKRGFPEVDLIVVDEAHGCAGSQAYRRMIEHYAGIPVIGLSATPFSKGLGKHYDGLGKLFEDLVVATTIGDLVKLGYLVDAQIYAPCDPDLSGVKIVAGDYHEEQLGQAMDKPALIGDIVSHWLRLGQDKPTVCFATNIAHSKHITEQFLQAGIAAEHIDCYTSEDDRKDILGRVSRGETRVISNVGILCEGWDFPACEVMILARPTKSIIRYIQMAGRVLRPFPGKTIATILDHSGSARDLGYPTDDLPLMLDDGKPKKSAQTPKEKPKPEKCSRCTYLKPPRVHMCPMCGFKPERRSEVQTVEGKLSKLERKRAAMTSDTKRMLFAELKGLQQERGWSDGRTAHVFRDITGVWPNSYRSVEPVTPSAETLAAVRHLNIRFAKRKQKEAHGRGNTAVTA